MWNQTIDKFMLELDFKKCETDHCIYVNRADYDMIFVALYVDDLVLASNNDELLKLTKKALGDRFDMTDLENLKYFLGTEVDQDVTVGTISIHQSKFAKDILEKFGMEHSNPVKTPREPGLKLTRSMCEGGCKHGDTMANVPYRNAVECLMYLMVGTRLDLAAAVGVLIQFAADPCPTHWQALKRVFRYVQGTQTHGIEFQATSNDKLPGYSDADWAGDVETRRSTSGYALLMNNGCIIWRSKKQRTVALSSTELRALNPRHMLTMLTFVFTSARESGHLQLAGAPLFLRETHVAAEREAFAVHQRSRLVHKLYARLPVGLFLPDLGARGKLFSLMLAAAVTPAAKTRVNSLIMELSRVECSSLSPIVAFVFNDRPTRDSWAKADLRVGNCRLQLLVADDPATVDDKIGYTDITTSMLYQVHVLGKSSAFPSEIRSWVAAATSTPVLTVESREADGAHFFGAHRWVVTFDSMECPKELDRKHRILVTTGDKSIEAVLMHPRKSTREPCQRCLSVRHFRKDCAAVDPESTCASYTLSATASVTSHTSLTTHADGWIKATEILRQKVAPGLGDKLRRASMVEGAPKRQKTVIHKREVAARVEAKAAVTAELLAIRRSKLKAATNHYAKVKKAAAMAAAAPDSLPTSVPQPVSGQHGSLKSCEVAPAAVPAAPGASSEGATSTVVNENDSDAGDMATADLPALFVVGEHAVSTVFEVPPSTAVDGQDRTEVDHSSGGPSPSSLAATMDIDELEASVPPSTASPNVWRTRCCTDGPDTTAINSHMASPLPPGLEAVLAAQDTDSILPIDSQDRVMAGPLPAIPRTQSPSPDAVEAWNAVAAVQREANDHAATLASSRRHKARVMPAPRLGCPQPVASGMVVEVAKLLQPTSPCVRLTSEEVSECICQKRQNGITIVTWRRRTSSTPVLPANGEKFSIWID
uniref:Reverse transcriptase Ty1/copia-type domain-containing protein n=1 Tax=Peronospora matthiolae TaxID=2874970 RepID=A0AAV1V4J1_9STRA